jgi:tRNA threonylcarbamoyladenosine biosynthesis protein TsaE
MTTAEFLLRTQADTARWGEALGRCLRPNDVLALIGELGSGKTTLTQSIAHGMGLIGPVTSPTFTLIQEYLGSPPMFHMDPYRLSSPQDLADLGLEEYFMREGVVVVEWADRIEESLPQDRLTIHLHHMTPKTDTEEAQETFRLLTARAGGPRSAMLISELHALPEIRKFVYSPDMSDYAL